MKVLNHKSGNRAGNQRDNSERVELNAGLHLLRTRLIEGFESKSAELGGLAAASSRGFSGSDLNLIAKFVALEFAGVNGASMVPPWSDSGPRADSLASGDYGQSVSHININNLVPAQGNGCEGVRDDYPFVEDFNLWVNKNEVGGYAAGRRPKAARDRNFHGFGHPETEGQHRADRENESRQDVATDWPKNLFVTHASIIAGDK